MLGNHRINKPIIAMFAVDGHHEAATVPAGTIIHINGKKFNGDRLMEVQWEGRLVLMFTQDLQVNSAPA